MEHYTLKPYTPADHDFVYETKKIVYKKYVEQNWGDWNEDKQKEFFADFINKFNKDILIVMLQNEKIGFYHGNNIDDDNFELGNICILPQFQGKGIGTKIMQKIIKEHKHQNIHLQYFKQNPVEKLYIRLGFKKEDETQHHIKMVLNKQI